MKVIGQSRLPLAFACVFALLALPLAAQAAKPSQVAKIPGKAWIVRASDANMLACWSQQTDGKYKLYAIKADKGDPKEIATSADPGGMCWILGRNQLLYTTAKAVDNSVEKYHDVTYFVYDPATGESRKLSVVKDVLETYRFDPISSDDGKRAFHMTVGTRKLPSFNLYFPEGGQLLPRDVRANIGADYDLSSDGSTLYWSLEDTTGKSRSIVGWSFDANSYTELYQFPMAKDPSESSGLIKVNSPRKQAAMMAYSAKDPTLKLCVYSYADPKKLSISPVNLAAETDVLSYDWKGRSGVLYILYVTSEGTRKLIEWDVTSRKATALFETRDAVESVEYSVPAQTYYYSVVAEAKGKNSSSIIMRLK